MSLRLLVAGLIMAVAVGAAVWLHGYREYVPFTTVSYSGAVLSSGQGASVSGVSASTRPSWADPLAAGIVVAALALGASIVAPRPVRPSGGT
jgi:hypothetical protein